MTGCSFSLWFGLTLGLLFLLAVGKLEERNFRIIIEDVTPKAGNMNLFGDLRCNVTQLNSRSFVNCNFRLNQQIKEIQMDSTLDLLRPNKPVVRLYNVHFDACQYLTMSHKNPLFGVFQKSINTAFNDTLKCPLRADFNYTLSNWYLNENNFPSIVPECTVKALTKLHSENKLVLTLILRGRVVHTK